MDGLQEKGLLDKVAACNLGQKSTACWMPTEPIRNEAGRAVAGRAAGLQPVHTGSETKNFTGTR